VGGDRLRHSVTFRLKLAVDMYTYTTQIAPTPATRRSLW
jgi:hypothetical protein